LGRINQDIVEYAFSPKSTLSYDMTLLVGSDSIYYMVNDAQLNVLALRSYHFDFRRDHILRNSIQDIFLEDELLREPYKSCKIALSSPHFTLIPEKMYDPREHQTYFGDITSLSAHERLMSDPLKAVQMQNVYVADNELLTLLQNYFPNQKSFHTLSALLQGYQRIAEMQAGHQVFVNLRDGLAQIFFFEGRNLIFTNNFMYRTPQDALYYVLMTYEQFKLNPEQTPLGISGALTQDGEIYRLLYRYIRHVHFLKAPSYLHFGNQFTGILPHAYFDLFSLKLCEK
jgi:hypothetical protein